MLAAGSGCLLNSSPSGVIIVIHNSRRRVRACLVLQGLLVVLLAVPGLPFMPCLKGRPFNSLETLLVAWTDGAGSSMRKLIFFLLRDDPVNSLVYLNHFWLI